MYHCFVSSTTPIRPGSVILSTRAPGTNPCRLAFRLGSVYTSNGLGSYPETRRRVYFLTWTLAGISPNNASVLFKGSLTPIPTAVFVTLLEFLPTLVLLGRRSSQGLGNA